MKNREDFVGKIINNPLNHYKNWPYKNTAFLVVSLLIFFYFIDSNPIQKSLTGIGSLGYFGAFVAGILFVSVFTIAPASVLLFEFAKNLNPISVATLAGFGAVLGDYLIFRFLKDRVFEELDPIFNKIGGSIVKKIFLTPFFSWLIPILGAFIIASPLPDEVGISLMGLSKVKNWHFILITFLLNAIGIFIVIALAKSL